MEPSSAVAHHGQQAALLSEDPDPEIDPENLPSLLEALLLVAPEPTEIEDLAAAAGTSRADVETALAAMERDGSRGWVIVRHKSTVHLATAPRFAAHVRRFLHLERESRLSGAALETLALIAYRQPVTRAEIEGLRGVDCSGVLATLHARGLIDIAGRLASVGNPIQYATSVAFLRQFGLQSLAELPALDDLIASAADQVLEAKEDAEHEPVSKLDDEAEIV